MAKSSALSKLGRSVIAKSLLDWTVMGDARFSDFSNLGFFWMSIPSGGSSLTFSAGLFSVSFLIFSTELDFPLLPNARLDDTLDSCLLELDLELVVILGVSVSFCSCRKLESPPLVRVSSSKAFSFSAESLVFECRYPSAFKNIGSNSKFGTAIVHFPSSRKHYSVKTGSPLFRFPRVRQTVTSGPSRLSLRTPGNQTMKNHSPHGPTDHLYLELSQHTEDLILPLHTSIVLFLLSYCDSMALKVVLVSNEDTVGSHRGKKGIPQNLAVDLLSHQELPAIVQSCRLPALVEKDGNFCRAGLAVTLRHIVQRTCSADSNRKDVAELLGFKKTCLKACAEVSHWTRLCEISIPLAVEAFLKKSPNQAMVIPPEILHLERKLEEPVRVHNDDKIRRQKLQRLSKDKGAQPTEKTSEGPHRGFPEGKSNIDPDVEENQGSNASSVEFSTALSKLSVEPLPSVTTREPSCIRKVKTIDLPALEHVFAEGLFFTLTDLVLLPCLHYFFVSLGDRRGEVLAALPLLSHWYQRVQEIPRVKRAAASCEIQFLTIPAAPILSSDVQLPISSDSRDYEAGSNDLHFRGGPRPTMSKLEENGISAEFTPHPCPSWSVDWSSVPAAVNPTEGNLPCERAVRKQQQLNSLVSVVTSLARPGDTIVDFCSGGGHVAIVLAHTLPSCQVVLVENKEESLLRAKDRCEDLSLNNIWFVQANLDSFIGLFKIGVGLHACGVATDMVIDRCIKAWASFVISPCCYGFIQNTVKFTFPRSQKFKNILSYKEHMVLCRCADQTAVQLPGERRIIGKKCMGLVDLDRAWAAKEHDYKVFVTSMEPESCSPKNNLIVGHSPNHIVNPNA